jgi:hypothetical protein
MKMILANKTKVDCGVVAAFNASAWCNIKTTYRKVEKLARSCGYGKSGIYDFQFANLINKLNIPAKRIDPKSRENLEKKLYSGKFFIFFYTLPQIKSATSGHIVTAFLDHTGEIKIVNSDGYRRTWWRFVTDLNENGVKNFIAWEIPRRPVK